jgi:hypothetical protein
MQGNLEQRRTMLAEISAGQVSLAQAAERLGLSYRQMRRIWKRYSEEGAQGIEHRNKGRQSNRSYSEGFKESVLDIYVKQHRGLGPTEFCKILNDRNIAVDHETLRRWLISKKLWTGQRTRSESCGGHDEGGFGQLLVHLALRGSWLGEKRPSAWLHLLRDEDTGIMLAAMDRDYDDSAPMRLLWAWIERYGIPVSLSCRKPFIIDERLVLTLEQEFLGLEPRTAFAQACDKLGIETLPLNPAKGKCLMRRVEDHTSALTRAFEKAGLVSVGEADVFLRSAKASAIDPLIGGRPACVEDCHVPILDGTDLRNIFCFRTECEISVESSAHVPQSAHLLISRSETRPSAKRKVTVVRWLDGSTHFLFDGKELSTNNIPFDLAGRVAI